LTSGSVDQSNTYVFEVLPQGIGESASRAISYWSTGKGDDCPSSSSIAMNIKTVPRVVTEAMKRLEEKIACAADVQQGAVN
jgi:hypothetical protein